MDVLAFDGVDECDAKIYVLMSDPKTVFGISLSNQATFVELVRCRFPSRPMLGGGALRSP